MLTVMYLYNIRIIISYTNLLEISFMVN